MRTTAAALLGIEEGLRSFCGGYVYTQYFKVRVTFKVPRVILKAEFTEMRVNGTSIGGLDELGSAWM